MPLNTQLKQKPDYNIQELLAQFNKPSSQLFTGENRTASNVNPIQPTGNNLNQSNEVEIPNVMQQNLSGLTPDRVKQIFAGPQPESDYDKYSAWRNKQWGLAGQYPDMPQGKEKKPLDKMPKAGEIPMKPENQGIEQTQKVDQENGSKTDWMPVFRALSGSGDIMAGKPMRSQGVFDEMEAQRSQSEEIQSQQDPNSPLSKQVQQTLKALLPNQDFSQISYYQATKDPFIKSLIEQSKPMNPLDQKRLATLPAAKETAEQRRMGYLTANAKGEQAKLEAEAPNIEKNLNDALILNEKTLSPAEYKLQHAAAYAGMKPSQELQNTDLVVGTMMQDVIGKMRATFGAQFTEREGEVLKALEGASVDKPKELRAVAIKRVQDIYKQMVENKRREVAGLTGKQLIQPTQSTGQTQTGTLPQGLTEEDIQFNMKKYGKTRDEVIAKYTGK